MRNYDKQAQGWVNNPHAWQEHEEDFVVEQFKQLWQSAKTPLMVLFCIAAISGWAIWL